MDRNISSILVTGANGFIGTNLILRLTEMPNIRIIKYIRGDDTSLAKKIRESDVIIHLAAVNRPRDDTEFENVNVGFTTYLCQLIEKEFQTTGKKIPVIFTSSIQAELENPYGKSKFSAETALKNLSKNIGNSCVVYRLPGVFGKWSKPNYNSVVATFCYNIARNLPIKVNEPAKTLRLVYIDDVVSGIINTLEFNKSGFLRKFIKPQYEITVDELARHIYAFHDGRSKMDIECTGIGFTRALYATYVSHIPSKDFSYSLAQHVDDRGKFVEILKTKECGQISYFTAHPGVTRGSHYHNTKTEKFLVVKGQAKFCFVNLMTNEEVEIWADDSYPKIVDTIPGWVHDITNVGDDDLTVLLWASEKFDPEQPDTISRQVENEKT